MKICLLTCAAPFLIDEKVFPPLGLLAVGTALRLQGHDVSIRDVPASADCYGIGPTTPEYSNALTKLHSIRSRFGNLPVVIGGSHVQNNAEECLADGFDTVVLGDGENITSETFETPGVVLLTRKPLETYPMVDRSLVDIKGYRYEIDSKLTTTMLTSRGCPYHCGFCAKVEDKVRYQTVASIEAEVAYLKKQWDYHALMLFDDTFIVQKDRAIQICEVMKKYKMTWRCFVRGDLVLKHGTELVDAMARSGCVEVGIGVESGSDTILSNINKGESVATIQQAIFHLRIAGIRVKGFFIVGLPGESRSTLRETRWFLRDTKLDSADFTVYQPYRGSPIWNHKNDYDVSWTDLPTGQQFYKGRSGEYQSAVCTSGLTENEIVDARDELEGMFRCQQ